MERRYQLIAAAVAALVYLAAIPAPPNLMDDVDAVQAQIARNMLESGDWVTARLNGVAYLEKSPLIYWLMAASFAIFGVHDWAARLPLALGVVALAWATARFSTWAYGARAGLVSGLSIATCVGLWLFTRIQIPDALLTLAVVLALWGWLRALEGERRYAYVAWAAIGVGLLLKALIAVLFPIASLTIFLVVTGEWRNWRALRPFSGLALTLLITVPWHVAAALANPPLWDFTLRSTPGEYRGFFWFYFLNEHVFRFLNMRYPRDYNTVPRVLFWAFHLLWLFPWTGALLGVRLPVETRARRATVLCLCWIGFVLVFFTFSTTQEYYSMPIYPAFALLIGLAVSRGHTLGLRIAGGVFALAGLAIAFLLASVWNTPAPGDISQALTSNPDAYTLSLGHMGDLTLQSFAYLKLPLLVALVACIAGSLAIRRAPFIALSAAMILFLHAARLALIAFDPYLGSRELAEAYRRAEPGELIVDNQYYTFSSVFFYANVPRAWLLNGRKTNLEYGSYAPGAPQVFVDDARFAEMWREPKRYYVIVEKLELARIEKLAGGRANLILEKASGGKLLFKNR